MATWVLGDVQGCFAVFRRLLRRIDFRVGRDRLWFAGDLVNRGPDSLAVLRWVREHEDSVVAVLGNHDLHLLAQAMGLRKSRWGDSLQPVLDAPDGDDLCDWLAARPLLHQEDGFVMVHAGILPKWTLKKAVKRARRAEKALRSDRGGFLRSLYRVRNGEPEESREAATASVLTRIRAVDRNGKAVFDFDGSPESLPRGTRPWFEARPPSDATILFGHWSTLGLLVTDGAVCLDSGCVWGGSLTAMRLEDGALAVEPTLPGEGLSVS